MADKVWHCKSCNHVESAQDEYKVGDSEPCVHCKDGTARVYSANGFDPDFHNKVVVATGIPREYFPLNFEDAKPKSKVGVEVIEEFPACDPDMSRLTEIKPGMVYACSEPEFVGKMVVRKDLHILPITSKEAHDIAREHDHLKLPVEDDLSDRLHELGGRVLGQKKPEYCPCGGVILADTEDWETPRCYECWEKMGSPEQEPEDG